jgi:spore coat protein U-like protein
MRGPATVEGSNPSPCPSPYGRGDVEATVQLRKLRTERATASPLPGGEGQGEGRFALCDTPSGFGAGRLHSHCQDRRRCRFAMRDAAPERSGPLAAGMTRCCWFLTLALAAMPAAAANAQICTLGTTPVNFGSVSSLDATPVRTTGNITVTCSQMNGATVTLCVDIAQGKINGSGQRLLSKGGNATVPVQLYTDATYRFPSGSAWGHVVPQTLTGDGVITMPVPALLYINRNALVGTYQADFIVTLNYGTGPLGCGALAPRALTGTSSTGNALPKPVAAASKAR